MRTAVSLAALALATLITMLAPAPAEAADLRFMWGAPSEVRVTETVLKEGRTVKMSYTLRLEQEASGVDFVLHYSDFDFIAIEGKKVTRAMKKELGPALALTAAIPDVLVGVDGRAKAVVGFDKMLERVVDFLSEAGDVDPEQAKRLKAYLSNPGVRQPLETKMYEVWNSWVGAWVGMELAAGDRHENPIQLPIAPGITMPGVVTVAHKGKAKRPRGAWVLEQTTSVAGPGAAKAMEQFLQATMAAQEDAPAISVATFERSVTVETTTDPKTLRPAKVVTRDRRKLQLTGAAERNEIEEHTYEFKWKKLRKARKKKKK